MGIFCQFIALLLLVGSTLVKGTSFVVEPVVGHKNYQHPRSPFAECDNVGGAQDLATKTTKGGAMTKQTLLSSISFMDKAFLVAATNILVSAAFRRDPYLTLKITSPRLVWDAAIMFMTQYFKSKQLPTVLSTLLKSTAIVDMLEAFLVAVPNSVTCGMQGFIIPRLCYSDFTMGFARICLLLQCLISGYVYWKAATTTFR